MSRLKLAKSAIVAASKSSIFTPLESLKCNGKQYTNTGIMNDGDLHIIDQIKIDSYLAKEFMIFGGRQTYQYAWGVYYNQNKSILAAQGKSFNSFTTNSYPINEWITIELKNGLFVWNNQEISMTTYPIIEQYAGPIYLDALYYQGGVDSRIGSQVRGKTKIYKNGVLVFDSEPCKLNETGEIGRWDHVSNSFKGNIGTGEYTEV